MGEETKLVGHTDWFVTWHGLLALDSRKEKLHCSQDRKVIIWVNKQGDGMSYTPEPLHVFPDVIWHVSWNFVGDVLAVSGGDNQVSLWKHRGSDEWECISDSSKLSEQRAKTVKP
ncbi:Protein SEC13 [Orchesella cincta]|uniref:Protein SEC13 homolog n=1 Tax=Orchesella cincta TaxID=48709 RepID=A0A1D2M0P2_ORCCI|nr:Protein SEC13 [Orchesella cincta]